MNNSPRISVVIAVRDSRKFLNRCLAALKAGNRDSFECIVADDASLSQRAPADR